MKEWKKTWITVTVILTCFSFLTYQVPVLWKIVAEWRINIPTKFLSSFRLWSLLNWQIWVQTAYVIAKEKNAKFPVLGAFAVWSFLLGLGDTIWTFANNLKWNFMFHYEDWVRLQPLQQGISYHSVTLIVALIFSLIILRYGYKNQVFNVKRLFMVMSLFFMFSLTKVLFAPNPAWTDWGYLSYVHPELQICIPQYAVFVINDLIPRSLILLAILFSGEREDESINLGV